jgi:hypothetical protein
MSTQEKPIHYEPHPVSPERKAELVAKGVRIIDAIFDPNPKPAKAEKPAQQAQATKQGKEPKQPAKAEKPAEPEAGQKPAEGEQPKHEGEAPKE